MAYGVTAAGFVEKPIETILAEIEAAQKASFGDEFDVSSSSPAGQINGIMSQHLHELWEVLQAVYSAIDPDVNTDQPQTAIASLTGTVREAATKSTVTATVNLDAGITLSAGAVASVSGSPDSRFVTTVDATNGGGSPADVSVTMEAETAGPVVAQAGTLTEIETPQTGWNSITNAADATIGEDVETDEDLRIRREEELRRAGAAAVDAIRADVLAVDTVVSCTVFENTSLVTDGDGVPGKAVEVLVLSNPTSGDEDDIAQAIWDSRAAGIEDHGSASGTATDDQGNNQTVEFSRPSAVRIYVDVECTVDSDYPTDGDAQIKAAVAAWAQANLGVGDDVILSQIYPEVFEIAGVTDVTLIEIDTSTPPTGTSNIVITSRQLATIQSSDVRVTST